MRPVSKAYLFLLDRPTGLHVQYHHGSGAVCVQEVARDAALWDGQVVPALALFSDSLVPLLASTARQDEFIGELEFPAANVVYGGGGRAMNGTQYAGSGGGRSAIRSGGVPAAPEEEVARRMRGALRARGRAATRMMAPAPAEAAAAAAAGAGPGASALMMAPAPADPRDEEILRLRQELDAANRELARLRGEERAADPKAQDP
eukprot:tig00000492_g1396.t1